MGNGKRKECSPVALFVYRRLQHTRATVESLRRNAEAATTDLFIFSDGPKGIDTADDVAAVREYISTLKGFRSVTIVERPENLGLSRNIINGVTTMVESYGRVIVVEDDLVCSPWFLQYMNDGLTLYEDDAAVAAIHGYVYPVRTALPETFFLRGADCWGWATWRRAWRGFQPDGISLLNELELKQLTELFDFGGAFPFSQMLRDQIEGLNDSWAIRWYASAFLLNQFTLYPGRSLVRNIGNDASGTHCGSSEFYSVILSGGPIQVQKIRVEDCRVARLAIGQFAGKIAEGTITRWIPGRRMLKRLLHIFTGVKVARR